MSTWLLSFDRSVSDKTTGVNFGLLKLLPIEIFAPNLVSESPDIFTHYRVVVDGLICVQISVEERGLTQQTTTTRKPGMQSVCTEQNLTAMSPSVPGELMLGSA